MKGVLRLKEIRNEYQYSQLKLSEQLGVSRSAVAMWESGSSQPDNDMLLRIADIFGVSTDYLLGKNGYKKKRLPQSADAITFDDFTYAMHNEAKDLTPENKQKLLELAQFFKEQQQKEERGRKQIKGRFLG